jgi:hypothetical protein
VAAAALHGNKCAWPTCIFTPSAVAGASGQRCINDVCAAAGSSSCGPPGSGRVCDPNQWCAEPFRGTCCYSNQASIRSMDRNAEPCTRVNGSRVVPASLQCGSGSSVTAGQLYVTPDIITCLTHACSLVNRCMPCMMRLILLRHRMNALHICCDCRYGVVAQ